jgi:tetratricopeptide (TPR) repeat protein
MLRAARSRPYLAVGWLWFLVTLVPVVGLVQVGKQALADRYTYLPYVGLFIIIGWAVPDALSGIGGTKGARVLKNAVLAALALAWIAALGALAWKQAGYWHSNVALWTHALAVTTKNELAQYNLGTTLATEGDIDGAIGHLRESIRIEPKKYDAYNNLGTMLFQQERYGEAMKCFRSAIRLRRDYHDAHVNLGTLLVRLGRYEEARDNFKAALKIVPTSGNAREYLADVEERMAGRKSGGEKRH